jgi:hypothetical protein
LSGEFAGELSTTDSTDTDATTTSSGRVKVEIKLSALTVFCAATISSILSITTVSVEDCRYLRPELDANVQVFTAPPTFAAISWQTSSLLSSVTPVTTTASVIEDPCGSAVVVVVEVEGGAVEVEGAAVGLEAVGSALVIGELVGSLLGTPDGELVAGDWLGVIDCSTVGQLDGVFVGKREGHCEGELVMGAMDGPSDTQEPSQGWQSGAFI